MKVRAPLLAAAAVLLAGLALVTGCAKTEEPPPPPAPKPAPPPSLSDAWTPEQIAFVEEKFGPLAVTDSGLRYKILQPGTGDETPPRASLVTVNYRGSLLSGLVFDDSWKTKRPIQFRVGLGGHGVIRGFDEGVFPMKKGERRLVLIPHWLGYGVNGKLPIIPPRAVLVFEIELVGWESTQKTPASSGPP